MAKMEGERVVNANEVVAFFFPGRLGRGAYFVRYCIFSPLIWGLMGSSFPMSEPNVIGTTLLLLVCIYFTFWVVLPRMRDISMRAYWLILVLVPVVGGLFGLVLLFRQSAITFPEPSDTSESQDSANPRQIA
jgi:uncharacterized membrane protein YhaH (DUF805 family)